MPRTRKTKKYHPQKYYAGLSTTKKAQRRKEIEHFGAKDWKDPSAYTGFLTDVRVPTRTSSYVTTLKRRFAALGIQGTQSLQQKAQITGVPFPLVRACYNRGLAAWRTGHRPGATEQQWGHARVASFLVCGKTYYGPDADLVRAAKAKSAKARRWWKACPSASS
jgi:hypothetical protein